MKGRSPTGYEKRLHDQLASTGCIACRVLGHDPYSPVSIHHIHGRTRKDAHMYVIPLCAGHHQAGTGASGLVAVHPDKAEFERLHGTQAELMQKCIELISDD